MAAVVHEFQLDEFKTPQIPRGTNEIWKVLPGSQTTVLNHNWVFELLYHGTRGPGKSDTLLMSYASNVGVGWGANWRGIVFRQTYKQLEDLIEKSKALFYPAFPGARFNHSTHTWTFPDGEVLLMRQYSREDDYLNYHGHEYPWIGWDELTNWVNLDGYKRMISLCRSSVAGMPRMVRSTTNPYGPGHGVVKAHFELPAKDGIVRRKTYEIKNPLTGVIVVERLTRAAIKGTIWENTVLLNAQPGYVAQLKEYARNPAELKAWLEGDWNIVAGGMFNDVWSEEHNVVRRFKIPVSWRVDRSFDWGSSAPFSVGWWAQSDGSDYADADGLVRSSVRGDLFRIHEWYGWNGQPNKGLQLLDPDIARGILEREMGMGLPQTIHPGPADGSIYDVKSGVSTASEMLRSIRMADGRSYPGVKFYAADKTKRVVGWQQIRVMMRGAWPNEGRPRERPGLFVMDHCAQFRRTVPTAVRSEKNLDEIAEKTEDHVCDEVRYRVRATGVKSGVTQTVGMF